MNIFTQYILQAGIERETFFILVSIPVILVLIILFRRIIGFRTFELYIPLTLATLTLAIGIKKWLGIFILVLILMIIIRFLLKKISALSMTDSLVLNSIIFSSFLFIIVVLFLFLPDLIGISFRFDVITLLTIIFMGYYSEKLVSAWEVKRLKNFISAAAESLTLIIGSYFLLTWSFIKGIIISRPIETLFVSIALILLLGQWRLLKIKELFEFREVIKNVELPKKK